MAEFWEDSIYGAGKLPRCPYDYVASSVFRYAPQKPRRQISILELGCGPGNNLWFLNQEGFDCAGCDVSPTAIEYARARLGPGAELKISGFPDIPFEKKFDLVFERDALVCVPLKVARETLANIRQVLTPDGKIFLTPYSSQADTVGYACHYTREMLEDLLADCTIIEFHHVHVEDVLAEKPIRGEWHLVATPHE
jgi:SAM-dependent methyltransferase